MEPGCYKTHQSTEQCYTCEIFRETKSFHSVHRPRKIYSIEKPLTCTSSFVIYLVNCLKCKGQYVGKTEQMLKDRHISGHRSEIRNQSTPFGKHFNRHREFELIAIEQVASVNRIKTEGGLKKAKEKLDERESYWREELGPCTINVQGCE